ncbi:MAG: hypothetical protein EBZ77_09800, partial [Chitinophagia bacterium]|nr:hypothetical protein [Chitinophagia bacterium]
MPTNSSVVKSNELFFEALKARLHQDSKRAIELFEQFVLVNTNSPAAYYELAKLYVQDKKGDLAEKYISKAIALDVSNKWYKELYAEVLSKQGKYEMAGQVIAEIADTEVTDDAYAALAADYFDRAKKFDKAITYIDKAIQRSGNDEEIIIRKMEIYLHMDDVDKAADVVKTLIAGDPRNGRYYKLLAELYENNKRPQDALKVYQQAQQKLPDDPTVDLGLSEHYLRQGDTANFRTYARRAITNNKLDAETQIQLFFSYVQGMNDSLQITEGLPLIEKLLT